jgi:hypothetical protein
MVMGLLEVQEYGGSQTMGILKLQTSDSSP